MEKVREKRPDILLLAGVPSEAPDVICAAADLVFHPDVAEMGTAVAEAAAVVVSYVCVAPDIDDTLII